MTMSDSAAADDAKAEKKKPSALEETVEIIKTVVYALGIALFLRVLFFQPFTIPSESMEPALLKGDYIIVSKWSYGYSRHSIPFSPPIFSGRIFGSQPHRGDIVVFKLPRDGHTDYIKRLIGLPGDRIQVRDGVVFVNGQAIPRQVVGPTEDPGARGLMVQQVRETMPGGPSYITFDQGPQQADNTTVYTVPQNCYFFMGDNRDNSLDSRFNPGLAGQDDHGCRWNIPADAEIGFQAGVGFVPAENLVGKAQIILLSWDEEASLFKPWTWFTHARPGRFFRGLH
jgi:signal peptidase I